MSNKYKVLLSFIFVESQSYVGLLFISIQSSIKTSYWISHWIQLLLPTPFTFTSLDYRRYSKNSLFYNTLSKNPINLFTINNKKKLKILYSMRITSILLTDENLNESNLYLWGFFHIRINNTIKYVIFLIDLCYTLDYLWIINFYQ